MAGGTGHDRGPLERRPALLPLIVAAIAVPIVAAFALGGPPAGLAAGALAAAVIVVLAVRQRPGGPIEVAPSSGGRSRLLLVIDEAIEDPRAAEQVAGAARSLARDAEPEPEILVLAPARNRLLAHWLSDVDEARLDAQRRLVLTIGLLTAAGLDARGEVGDPDAMLAIEDALRRFAADEVMIATAPGAASAGLVSELRERLGIPVGLALAAPG